MSLLAKELKEARLSRGTGIEQDIIDQIYSGYMSEDVERQKTGFAPSGLFYGSGACAKRWYHSFEHGLFESKATPQGVAKMQSGIDRHKHIQDAMVKSGFASAIEHEIVVSDPPLRAFVDAIANVNGVEYVVEIKTVGSQNWEYRKKTGKIADYHLGQVLMYMHFTGIEHGMVIYENNDDKELHVIVVEMNEKYREFVENVLNWCREVWQLHVNGQIPKRSFRKSSKVCKSCPVEQRCNMVEGKVVVDKLVIAT